MHHTAAGAAQPISKLPWDNFALYASFGPRSPRCVDKKFIQNGCLKHRLLGIVYKEEEEGINYFSSTRTHIGKKDQL
jgi:hypothetical protein